MAYADYIHCATCDDKLIPDGHVLVREHLDKRYGCTADGVSTWQLLCPKCIADLTRQLGKREAMLDAIETALAHAGENVGERLVSLEAEVSRYQDELLEALRERDEARALLAERKWNPTEHPQ